MSVQYRAIQWSRQKRLYDSTLAGILILGIGLFIVTSLFTHPGITAETLIIRGTATAAFVLLHVILCIGPLCRLDKRFLPLLYNRRHLGVTMFLLAAVHGIFSIIQFHALGNLNPLVSLFVSYGRDYNPFQPEGFAIGRFPFEPLGFGALVIFFFLAATSHDFWLKNLGPSIWKSLHLMVYVAYGLVFSHVVLGALQSERSIVYPILLIIGAGTMVTLHLLAYRKEALTDSQSNDVVSLNGFSFACYPHEIEEGKGKVILNGRERVAIFRKEDRLYGIANVCRHQGGPLGEGRIRDGCVTCPWHGWQYKPEDGCSPPPFTEVVPTYTVKIVDGKVYIENEPNALGVSNPGASANGNPRKLGEVSP